MTTPGSTSRTPKQGPQLENGPQGDLCCPEGAAQSLEVTMSQDFCASLPGPASFPQRGYNYAMLSGPLRPARPEQRCAGLVGSVLLPFLPYPTSGGLSSGLLLKGQALLPAVSPHSVTQVSAPESGTPTKTWEARESFGSRDPPLTSPSQAPRRRLLGSRSWPALGALSPEACAPHCPAFRSVSIYVSLQGTASLSVSEVLR